MYDAQFFSASSDRPTSATGPKADKQKAMAMKKTNNIANRPSNNQHEIAKPTPLSGIADKLQGDEASKTLVKESANYTEGLARKMQKISKGAMEA